MTWNEWKTAQNDQLRAEVGDQIQIEVRAPAGSVPPAPKEAAPFDPGHSRLLRAVRRPARGLAVAAGALLVLAGVLVLAGAEAGAALAGGGSGGLAGARPAHVPPVGYWARWRSTSRSPSWRWREPVGQPGSGT
jgi:hypothetical protein